MNDTTKTYPRTLEEAFPDHPAPLERTDRDYDLVSMFCIGFIFGLMLASLITM
jgi:hypothetical protein